MELHPPHRQEVSFSTSANVPRLSYMTKKIILRILEYLQNNGSPVKDPIANEGTNRNISQKKKNENPTDLGYYNASTTGNPFWGKYKYYSTLI